ncbi:hypothetical protein ACJIZ3_003478 [Penstemon smallii]|uniref:Enoyl reductase (ER) domain-containing protein n=1 Tax=Penstemon smallii TaxID=265156 RepID=A0ABD3UAV9_9LAMI
MFVKHIPAGVSLVEAAALPSTICFTYYCLAVLRQATRGKKVLIHAASRGFGLIALQYAKYCGCDVFAAAETQEKLETCGKLGADVCINYSKEDFSKRVKDETAGKGVDIILDVKGPYYFAKNVNCLARRGTLITLGFESGNAGDLDCSISKSISEKKLRHLGANIFTLPPREVGTIFSQVEELVWPLFKDGTIKPTVSRVFCFSQAAEAHKAMESDIVAGNVVLVP